MKLSLQKISLRNIADGIYAICRRFPLTVAFVAALTAFTSALVLRNDDIVSETFTSCVLLYLGLASVLSYSMTLWREDAGNGRRPWLQVAIHLLLIGFIAYVAWDDEMSRAEDLGMAAIAFSIVVSVFVLPFLRGRNDVMLWNFGWKTVLNAAVSCLVTLIVMGGLMLLLLGFDKLFGVAVPDKAYGLTAVLSWLLLAPLLLLHLTPSGEEKYDSGVRLGRFGAGVVRYLFLPILGAYLIVLYVYAAKILFTWQLPDGWVSYLVSALISGSLLVIVMLYPLRSGGVATRLDMFVFRWLPALVMPLLLLMTVGIFRRLDDYGITIARGYLLAFNLWCYFACIVLFVTRSGKIWWLPVSFALLALVLSVGPQNLTDSTRRIMQKQVKELMGKAGETEFPLDSARYESLLERADTADAYAIDDKLQYLYSNYEGRSGLEPIVDSTVIVGNFRNLKDEAFVVSLSDNGNLDVVTDIPQGYSSVTIARSFVLEKMPDKPDFLRVRCEVDEKGNEEYEFVVAMDDLRRIGAMEGKTSLTLVSDRALFSVSSFYVSEETSNDTYGDFYGILFLK